ncbi:hypothetical protein DL98DRAFT_436592, partial [Cadophora sp. DSE1049]
KTLTKYLNKSFIRVSNLLASAFVFFVYKLKSKGLRTNIYINYRSLNRIIKKNRYLLFLIYKTL